MQSQSLALGNSLLLEMGHTGKDVVTTSMGGEAEPEQNSQRKVKASLWTTKFP